ncbi:hydroxyacid-oxoacid transhydrogenase [Ignicoccus hospitalis]|uniref:hydroxyacid-oxoacid transhydrogenase n=1 Tax=Ignicoccus hospitalis TaxID=160233 RepID=UPI000325872C|nr:hydroxyacid-oxoacid transhydrogenase [Ignicoccus hospitalis]HIH90380.1 iron-containing alcohol dehydrogenase [Desulfurococcaceae archaeon]
MTTVYNPFGDYVWEFRSPRSKFGPGALNELKVDLERLRVEKPFLITTKGWVKRGIVDRLREILGKDVPYWDGVEPEPSAESVEEAAKALAESGADSVIAIGGGSALDTAKIANLLATYGGRVRDYVAPPYGEGKPVPGPVKPMVAVPTTAGTGSEVTSVAVVTLKDVGVKVGISSDFLRPSLALLDPELTMTVPPKVTADTGMDALTHAVESYIAKPYWARERPEDPAKRPVYVGSFTVTDALAERAIELIGKYLRRAVYQGRTDLEARSGMLIASYLAGLAFGNAGVGLAHAASYPLGGRYKVTHGEAVGILLPAVLEFNAPANYEKAKRVGELLTGEKCPERDPAKCAEWAANAIRELQRDIKFTPGLEAVGVKEEDLMEMAKETLNQKRLLATNPRPVTEEDVYWVYKRSMRNY